MAEEAIIARDVLLAEHVGARLHICHVSTAGSASRSCAGPSARGIRVTAEVTPHHLLLTDECAGEYDPVFKVNPPLRTRADVAALRAGLVEGLIDAVATDHAPHAVQDKECEWALRPARAWSGWRPRCPLWSTTLLDELGWDGIAERMSRAPARIAGLAEHGHDPAPGRPANLTLIDPAARWTVDPTALASRSRNTPYAGMRLTGAAWSPHSSTGRPTVLDGKAVR